jgi:PTS system mannose-specific IIA component
VVSRLLEDGKIEGVSGASLPMLLRVLTGRSEGRSAGKSGATGDKLRSAVERALSGGAEGVVHMNSDRCLDG